MNPKQIPQTDSIQELAHFFDTHDMADFDGQFEEVDEPVFELKKRFTLDLSPNEVEAIRRLAESKGITETELLREWVSEKLHAT